MTTQQPILQQRYQIQQHLSRKAGRQTVLACDIITKQKVIIKLLNFSKDFTWEDLKLFEREAETLKTLDHPAIPRYIDFFELDPREGKGYALVQSYIPGKSLEEYLQSGRIFTELEIQEIATQLLKILIYIHERKPPVIHRDIKPSNIVLADRSGNSVGKIYLVDFGSVQTLATKAGKTITIVGTYGYMPPEQFGGYSQPASDLYSLGTTLIALATGIHPADLPQQDLKISFADIVKLKPMLINWLQWLIEPSLEQRLSSAKEALSALETDQLKSSKSLANIQSPILYKPINTFSIFWNSVWRSTFIGGAIVMICAAIYSTAVYPIVGTTAGLFIGALIGFPTGFINGFVTAIITHLFFFPLKDFYQFRRKISIFSTIFSTFTSTFISIISLMIVGRSSLPYYDINILLFWTAAPAIITGLSMGVVSKNFAHWYENSSGVKNE